MPYRQNFPIPSEIDPPQTCLCIPIPDSSEWRAIVAGLLSEMTFWFNYERTGDNSGALCAAVWKDIFTRIDWGNMSCCCGEQVPVQYRYTEDGVLQRSTDEGETWEDAPQYDPRNYSPVFPPIPGEDGDDKRCAAATGAANLIKEQIGDQLTDDMGRYTLDQLVRDWVGTMLDSSNPFKALVTVVANQIFALVISVVRAALTEEVYHELQCALYCAMGEDASFSESEWALARLDILDRIPGVGGLFLEHLIFLLGVNGTTNLVRSAPDDTGDCSDCGCGSDGCATEWAISTPNPGDVLGEITFQDDDMILAQTTNINSGAYYVYMDTGSLSECCFISYEVLTSSAEVGPAFTACGSSAAPSNGILNPGACIWTLVLISAQPFTVQINKANCP